jgi:hypothetical protein
MRPLSITFQGKQSARARKRPTRGGTIHERIKRPPDSHFFEPYWHSFTSIWSVSNCCKEEENWGYYTGYAAATVKLDSRSTQAGVTDAK